MHGVTMTSVIHARKTERGKHSERSLVGTRFIFFSTIKGFSLNVVDRSGHDLAPMRKFEGIALPFCNAADKLQHLKRERKEMIRADSLLCLGRYIERGRGMRPVWYVGVY